MCLRQRPKDNHALKLTAPTRASFLVRDFTIWRIRTFRVRRFRSWRRRSLRPCVEGRRLRTRALSLGLAMGTQQRAPNNSMQLKALRAAADAERYAAFLTLRTAMRT